MFALASTGATDWATLEFSVPTTAATCGSEASLLAARWPRWRVGGVVLGGEDDLIAGYGALLVGLADGQVDRVLDAEPEPERFPVSGAITPTLTVFFSSAASPPPLSRLQPATTRSSAPSTVTDEGLCPSRPCSSSCREPRWFWRRRRPGLPLETHDDPRPQPPLRGTSTQASGQVATGKTVPQPAHGNTTPAGLSRGTPLPERLTCRRVRSPDDGTVCVLAPSRSGGDGLGLGRAGTGSPSVAKVFCDPLVRAG